MNWAGARRGVRVREAARTSRSSSTPSCGAASSRAGSAGSRSPSSARRSRSGFASSASATPTRAMIDVVNEPPPHTTPAYTAALGGAGASGYDWIVQAFKWARSVLPERDPDPERLQQDRVRKRQHPLHRHRQAHQGGRCAHRRDRRAGARRVQRCRPSTVQMYIDKMASQTGLPVYITEYDIEPRRRRPAAAGDAEPVHDVLEQQNVKGSRSGATSRGDLASEHRPDDERRTAAPGHDVADGLPRPLASNGLRSNAVQLVGFRPCPRVRGAPTSGHYRRSSRRSRPRDCAPRTRAHGRAL